MSGTGAKPQAAAKSTKTCEDSSLHSGAKMDCNKKTSPAKIGEDKNLFYFPVEKLTEQDLKKAKQKKVEVNGETIALISHEDKVFAIQEKCPHYGGPLHQGDIEDLAEEGPCIRCPWHSWKFSLETGKCISPQREDKCLKIYPVKITKDEIKIGFETIADSIFSTPP